MATQTKQLGKVAEYMKNVGKSAVYASIDVAKMHAPNITDFIDTNKGIFKDIHGSYAEKKDMIRSTDRDVKSNKIYAAGDQMLKSIKEDLKTGKFYNPQRDEEIYSKVMPDLDFDLDTDLDFSDNDVKIADYSSKKIAASVQASSLATSTAVARSAEYMVASNRASAKVQYTQNIQMMNTMSTGMSAIKTSIDYISNIMTGPMTDHMQNSKTFYEESNRLSIERNAMFKELLEMQRNLYKNNDSYNRSRSQYSKVGTGTFDARAYGKEIKKNLKDILSGQGIDTDMVLGDSFGSNSNMLMAFATSPIHALSKVLINTIIPVGIKSTVKSIDDGFSSLFSTIISRFNKQKGNYVNGFKQTIGELFGLTVDRKKSIDTSKYNKGAMSFDGITRKAIIEVIPGHLRRIEALLSKSDERIYDYESGKWKTAKKLRKELDEYDKLYKNGANRDMEKVMMDSIKELKLESAKEQARLVSIISDMLGTVYNEGGGFSFFDPSRDRAKTEKYFKGDVEAAKFFMKEMSSTRTGRRATRNWDRNIMNSNERMASQYHYFESDGGPYAEMFNGAYDKFGNPIGSTATSVGKGKMPKGSASKGNYKSDSNDYQFNGKDNIDAMETALSNLSIDTGKVTDADRKSLYEAIRDGNYEEVKSIEKKLKRKYTTTTGNNKVKKFINNLVSGGPSKIMAGAIGTVLSKADQRMFDILFGTDKITGKDGKPFKGMIDYMTNKVDEAFDKITNKINDVLDPLKKKLAAWFKPYGDNIKDKYSKAGKYVGNSFSRVANGLGFGGVVTPEDVSSSQHSAAGRYIRKTGLTMVSPGEVIIPSSFDKRTQGRQLAQEKKTKSQLMRALKGGNIGYHAAGTVDPTAMVKESTLMQYITRITGISPDKLKESKTDIKDFAPDLVGAGALGGGIGLAAGMPFVGAAIGAGAMLVHRSKLLQTVLFGTADDDSGLIKKNIQEKFKKYMPDVGAGGTVGALAGIVTGIGPIGGAIVGSTLGYLKKNKSFQDYMFGNIEEGKEGLINKEFQVNVKKAVPSMAAGAIGGILLGPFGIVGNSLMGAGLGALSTTETFKKMMLGEEDKDGIRHGGIIGALHEGVVDPLKASMKDFAEKGKEVLLKHVITPLKDFVEPATQAIKNVITDVGDRVKDTLDVILEKTIGMPLNEIMKKVTTKITGMLSKVLKVALAPVLLPFKAIGGIGNSLRQSQINRGRATNMSASERNNFRALHKVRGGISNFLGLDQAAGTDAMMENYSLEQLQGIKDSTGQFFQGKDYFAKEIHSKNKDAQSKLLSTLNSGKRGNKSYFDIVGFGKVKKLNKALGDGKIDEFTRILTDSGLTKQEQSAVSDAVSGSIMDINNLRNRSKNATTERSALYSEMQKLTGNKGIKKIKDMRYYQRNIESEIKARQNGVLPSDNGDLMPGSDMILKNSVDANALTIASTIENSAKAIMELIRPGSSNKFNSVVSGKTYDAAGETAKQSASSTIKAATAEATSLKAEILSDSNITNKVAALSSIYGESFNTTISDIETIDGKRINDLKKLKGSKKKLDSSLVDEVLQLDEVLYKRFIFIATKVNFAIDSKSGRIIIDKVIKDKNKFEAIKIIANTGFKIMNGDDFSKIANTFTNVQLAKITASNIKATRMPSKVNDLISLSSSSMASLYRESLNSKKRLTNVIKASDTLNKIKSGIFGSIGNTISAVDGEASGFKNKVGKKSNIQRIKSFFTPFGKEAKYDEDGNPLDDKETREALDEVDNAKDRDNDMAADAKKTAVNVGGLFSGLFGKNKSDKEDKDKGFFGFLKNKVTSVGSFFGKVLKVLAGIGVGATVMSSSGYAANWWVENAQPWLETRWSSTIKPGIENILYGDPENPDNTGLIGKFQQTKIGKAMSKFFEDVGSKGFWSTIGYNISSFIKNNNEKIIEWFATGIKYSAEYLVTPMVKVIIETLPSVIAATWEGIKEGLGFGSTTKHKETSSAYSDLTGTKLTSTSNPNGVGKTGIGNSIKSSLGINSRTSTNIVSFETGANGDYVYYDQSGRPAYKLSNGTYWYADTNSQVPSSVKLSLNPTSAYYDSNSDKSFGGTLASGAGINLLNGLATGTSSNAGKFASKAMKGAVGSVGRTAVAGGTLGRIGHGASAAIKGVTGVFTGTANAAKNIGASVNNGLTKGATAANGANYWKKAMGFNADDLGIKVAESAAESGGKGLLGKITAGITSFFSKIASNGTVLKVLNTVSKMFGKTVETNALSIALNKISEKIVAKVGSGLATTALTSVASAVATIPVAAIVLGAVYFVQGYSNTSTIFGVAEDLGFGYKLVAGFINAFLKACPGVSLIGSFIDPSIMVDIFVEHLAPLFGFDVSSLEAKRDNAQNILDKWNSDNPNETFDNIEDYNNKDKWTTKVGNSLKSAAKSTGNWFLGEKDEKTGERSGGVVGSIKNVASSVGTAVKGFFSKGADLTGFISSIIANAIKYGKGEIDVLETSITIDKDDPLAEIKYGIVSAMKPLMIPVVLITRIGKGIKEKVLDPIMNTAKSIFSTIGNTVTGMAKTAISGDIGALITYDTGMGKDDSNGNVMNVVGSVVGTITKISIMPVALLTAGIANVVKGVKTVVDKGIELGSNIGTTVGQMWDSAKAGDFKGLFSAGWIDQPADIMDHVSNAANVVTKSILAGPALVMTGVSWIGTKIKSFIGSIAESLEDSDTDAVMKKAQEGKISVFGKEYWDLGSDDPNNPMGTLSKITGFTTRLAMALPNLFQGLMLKIKDKFAGVVNWFKGLFGADYDEFMATSTSSESGRGRGRGGFGSHIYQHDPSVAGMKYGSGSKYNTISSAGCAPVAAANILNNRRGMGSGLDYAAQFAVKNGYKERNGGTSIDYFNSIFNANGIPNMQTTNKSTIRNSLRRGNEVVMLGQDAGGSVSPYSDQMHFITAKGYDGHGNVIVDDPDSPMSSLLYPESSVLNNMKGSVVTGMGRRGKSGLGRYINNFINRNSGLGSISDTEKNILIQKIHERTIGSESGGDYAALNLNDAGYGYSVGIIQFNSGLAKQLFTRLADKLNGSDKTTAMSYANLAGTGLSSSQGAAMQSFLRSSSVAPYNKMVQDEMCNELYWNTNAKTAVDMFKGDELKDLRSIVMIAHIANSGPALVDKWRKNHKASSSVANCLTETRNSLKSTDSYWGSQASAGAKQHQFYNGWMNIIEKDYESLKNWDGKSVNGSLNLSGSSSTGSDGSSSSKPNIFSAFTDLGKATLKGIYGEDIVNAFFPDSGSSSTGSSSDGTKYDNMQGNVSSDSTIANYQRKTAAFMKSYNLRNVYDQSQRNKQGSGPPGRSDCSSMAEWALRNALGDSPYTMLGGGQGSSYNAGTTYSMWENPKGVKVDSANSTGYPDEKNLQLGDFLLFGKAGSKSPSDTVHVEMYTGPNEIMGHGGGQGPKAKVMNQYHNNDYYGAMRFVNNPAIEAGKNSPGGSLTGGGRGRGGLGRALDSYKMKHSSIRSGMAHAAGYDQMVQSINLNKSYSPKFTEVKYSSNKATGTARGSGGFGFGGVYSMDYSKVLQLIVETLLSISSNTEALGKILTLLSENAGIQLSSDQIAAATSDSSTARTKLKQLLSQNNNTTTTTSLLKNSNTEYIVNAMEAIAKQ